MGIVSIDAFVNIDDIVVGDIVYARDNFHNSNKVRPWLVRSVNYEEEYVMANPITSSKHDSIWEDVEIDGKLSHVSTTLEKIDAVEIESIEPNVRF